MPDKIPTIPPPPPPPNETGNIDPPPPRPEYKFAMIAGGAAGTAYVAKTLYELFFCVCGTSGGIL